MKLWCNSHRICLCISNKLTSDVTVTEFDVVFYNKTAINISKNIKNQLTLQNVFALFPSLCSYFKLRQQKLIIFLSLIAHLPPDFAVPSTTWIFLDSNCQVMHMFSQSFQSCYILDLLVPWKCLPQFHQCWLWHISHQLHFMYLHQHSFDYHFVFCF